MEIKNGKIIKATEAELFKYYIEREYEDILSFPDYLGKMKNVGVEIQEEGGKNKSNFRS